ncbi:beta-lactamase [Colletotrichum navitas]|uniref:Beta-lactamase n=1 Tax=Colletotrichum navitas TaxID=681940 RepID=A0AAD8PK46_9PEZI|nr:beta-lactamase [Colletotrichum navitas]KAK1566233.1 beta-lactamase [Colletotrichum navitas]
MLRTSVLSLLASVAVATAATANVPTEEVPLLGPSFLSNFDPTDSEHIRNATESFPRVIEALFESGQLSKTDLVFAVDVFTAATNKSLYSHYHVGEDGKAGLTSGELNDGTIGRIGSVSKLFTTYAILVKAGVQVLDHPVTKYIPELLGNSSDNSFGRIRWDDITVGALASHQAGSGGVDGLARPDMTLEEIQAVSPHDLFNYLSRKRPVISPYRNAVYSDGGFSLLGQVLARLTGQTYADALRSIILEPLGLNGTTAAAPNNTDTNAINRALYTEFTAFGIDFPVTASSGGIYSNAADLRAFGLSILDSELLSSTNTSRWMKPLSGTGSLVELVGAPWEIARLAIPTSAGSNRTRISDLYTKAGGNYDYTCIFALSPDHGIGYSILVAGSTATPARWPIRDAVGELFIPAAEAAAADNARLNLAGTFVAASAGSNVTLSVDADGAGLVVESAFINGEDGTAGASARLFPTGLYSNSRSLSALYGNRGTLSTAFRLVTYPAKLNPRSRSEGGAGGLFDNSQVWMGLDAQEAVDEYIFTIEDGRLVNITSSYTQMTFMRSD